MMTPERRAERVLEQFGAGNVPVDVYGVARHLGVRVERADLGDDVSGVLVRNLEAAVIGVHFAHHPSRQRFTIAHELGHFVLHSGGTYVDRGTYVRFRNSASGTGTDAEEHDANQFAAALLMPGAALRTEFNAHPFDLADDIAVTSLAQKLGVSIQALTFRLMNLALLSPSHAASSKKKSRAR